MRRIVARTWLLVIWRSALSSLDGDGQKQSRRQATAALGLGTLRGLGEQVLELEGETFEVTDRLLLRRRQEGVRDDAGNGDAETNSGVVERLRNTFREEGRPLFRLRSRDGAERSNQTDNGTEQTDE